MSRVGTKVISVPKGVTRHRRQGPHVTVKGPEGRAQAHAPGRRLASSVDRAATLHVERADDSPREPRQARHDPRDLANMVKGVAEGFERKLEINGVGYRAEVAGQKLNMALGFSHPSCSMLPEGRSPAKVDKNIVDPERHRSRSSSAQTAAKMRGIRPPEPYKGKGIKYVEEVIRRKVGKTGAA